ncbi:TonB-dependent receptor [Chitinophagaceae bacterium LB-8]|uniref:TonB-dependent receptor n=1 Tax=Paraflavisolibacter caeni TaxID=2982496 RepID=A0A9X2XTS0_9BACT|nr:TonB-dependent receptor [Paraflavisolibacter caeni]MCU7548876.1 TonB-dependent receptor [Paraflavisolibacter caeni]
MRLTCRSLLKSGLCSLLFAALIVQSHTASAQQSVKRVFKGVVTNVKGEPVSGATVIVKGTSNGVSTDANGAFIIEAPENATVVVTSVGFQGEEMALRGQQISVRLNEIANNLNEVVVVGYGTQRKKDLTGSVAVIKVDDAKKTASYDVARQLQGQAAGISVQGSGEPGGFVNIQIRGASSFADNNPLWVVDGVPLGAPYDFNPNDIESIQVLKDASAGAIYGSRGANGVVIITTKKGKSGALRVNYTGTYGFQSVPKKIPVLNREQYQKYVSVAEKNAGIATLAPANDPANPAYVNNINTNWQDEMYKTGTIQDHNINLSGGNEFISFNTSLGYFDQTGTVSGPQKYNRYTLNNVFQGKKGRLSFGGKVAYTQSHKVGYGVTDGHAVFGGTVTGMLTAIPTIPVYDEKRLGGYGGSDQTIHRAISQNPVGLNNIVEDENDRNRMLGNIWGEVEIVKNLKYKLNLSYDRADWFNTHFEPRFDMGFYYLNNNYYFREQRGFDNSKLAENTLTYLLLAGKHKVDFLAGYTYQEDNNSWTLNKAQDATDLPKRAFSQIPGSAKSTEDWKATRVLLSYLGRMNYNYDDRYLLTVNVRRDGSSAFGPANKWGNFGGFSGAWNLSNEDWIQLPAFISSLKLRGGYGSLGNQGPLPNYSYLSYINTSANYLFGTTGSSSQLLALGTSTVTQVDPSLKWEERNTTSVAADMAFLNNKLTFTAEYYKNVSKDMLATIPIPASVGSVPSSIWTNVASMQNTGMEFTLGYNGQAGQLKYNVNANAYTQKNKVIGLGPTVEYIEGAGSRTVVGRSIGELYGYQVEGIFQSASDISKHAYQQAQTAPGDIMYKDINGDKRISDDSDRVYLGSVIPKLSYGFNFSATYKNFDFSFFIQGRYGNKVNNGVYAALMTGDYGNQHADALNYWTPTNTNTNVPRPVIGDPNKNNWFSSRFVQNGSYARLQSMQIGYTLPASLLERTKAIKSLRVNLSGQNLLTITKYKGYDPDFISNGTFDRGFDYGSFPNPRSIIFGLQLGL